MGAGGAANNGSNDTQVSGYEREILTSPLGIEEEAEVQKKTLLGS